MFLLSLSCLWRFRYRKLFQNDITTENVAEGFPQILGLDIMSCLDLSDRLEALRRQTPSLVFPRCAEAPSGPHAYLNHDFIISRRPTSAKPLIRAV